MVCYGVSETVFGEWSVMGSTIILVHSYYNVWLRAQLGWQSFLLRRDAVNKIKSLPTASNAQLEQYNDICAICYQVGAAQLHALELSCGIKNPKHFKIKPQNTRGLCLCAHSF